MLDKFLLMYKTKNKNISNMFDGIDIKNPLSTNDIQEMFYEYMTFHKSNENNPSFTDVYEYHEDVRIDNQNSDDIYAIIEGKESKIKYISLSYISLLSTGIKEKGLDKNWSIIKMYLK